MAAAATATTVAAGPDGADATNIIQRRVSMGPPPGMSRVRPPSSNTASVPAVAVAQPFVSPVDPVTNTGAPSTPAKADAARLVTAITLSNSPGAGAPLPPPSTPPPALKRKIYIPAYQQAKYKLAQMAPPETEEDTAYLRFMDAAVRRGFIRKVFSLLSMQLIFTLAVILVFILVPGIRDFVSSSSAVMYSALAVTFSAVVMLLLCDGCRSSYPMNYLALVGFTLAESYLLGVLSCFFSTPIVIMAVVGTIVVAVCLMLFAYQTKYDFTALTGFLVVSGVLAILFVITALVAPASIVTIVIAAVITMMFCGFIVYDTQLVIGARHFHHKLGPDDYVVASLNLYLDIASLFVVGLLVLAAKCR